MIIKMIGDVSGTRDGVPWPARGETIEVSDEEGAALCGSGMAKAVKDSGEANAAAPSGDVETATTGKTATKAKA